MCFGFVSASRLSDYKQLLGSERPTLPRPCLVIGTVCGNWPVTCQTVGVTVKVTQHSYRVDLL